LNICGYSRNIEFYKRYRTKISIAKNYLRSFGHSIPAVDCTFTASHGFAAGPELAFAGSFIDYLYYSFPNFNS
jgi:hypothetical protein